jgi:hypothetical protein
LGTGWLGLAGPDNAPPGAVWAKRGGAPKPTVPDKITALMTFLFCFIDSSVDIEYSLPRQRLKGAIAMPMRNLRKQKIDALGR